MKRLLLLSLIISSLAVSVGSAELDNTDTNKTLAHKIVLYYRTTTGEKVDAAVVEATLVAIDRYRLKYFPDEQFSKQDFIALAMVESNFNLYEVGTSGEVGIFQIMQGAIPRTIKNPFEIRTNTRLCMKVLGWKWEEQGDYKKAIIAYNGVVRSRKNHGAWNEKYWRLFQKRKTVLNNLGIK